MCTDQLEIPEVSKVAPPTLKECRSCGEMKNIEDYPHFSNSEAGRKNTCKVCSQKLSNVRRKLRMENPPPVEGNCPICKQYTTDWILDHCHFKDSFRGYICNSCNLGLGRFNDDPRLLKRAIKYLSKNKQNLLAKREK
jgi:hypothetical protein